VSGEAGGRLSTRLVVGLALAILLDTAVQVLWKRAADTLPELSGSPAQMAAAVAVTLLHQPLFLLVAALIAAQMINWLKTLDYADVSFAQPITALSYVSVAVVSRLWFGEAITPGRIAGMALILIGVALVARSDPNTPVSATPPGAS
jgi:drug/metabolite transporter (DMT)-like permease